MGYKTITFVAICILQGINSLPVENAALAPPPCTLLEATEINNKHLDEISARVDAIDEETNKIVTDAEEELNKSNAHATTTAQDILNAVQTSLDEAKQNDQEATACLNALQMQIQVANTKTNSKIAKCAAKSQKKTLKLQHKALKVQQKAQSVKTKGSKTIGKCAIAHYPSGSCAQLDACSSAAQSKLLFKVDEMVEQLTFDAQEVGLDNAECVTEGINEATKYGLSINLDVLNCASPQPQQPEPGHEGSGESGESESEESNEDGNDVVTEGPQEGTTDQSANGGDDQGEAESHTEQAGEAETGTESQVGQGENEQEGQTGSPIEQPEEGQSESPEQVTPEAGQEGQSGQEEQAAPEAGQEGQSGQDPEGGEYSVRGVAHQSGSSQAGAGGPQGPPKSVDQRV